MDINVALTKAKQQCKTGDVATGFRLLQKILATQRTPPLVYDRIGRLLSQYADEFTEHKKFRVLVCGQFTTTWLRTTLIATAWRDECLLDVVGGDYDNVMQSLYRALENDQKYDAVVLVPWHNRLFEHLQKASVEQCISDQLALWESAWQVVNRLGSRLIQVGFDYCYPGPRGSFQDSQAGGQIDAVRRLNRELRTHLPEQGYFVDVEQLTGQIGRNEAYDARRYYWTKQPFSEDGLLQLTRYLWAGLRATMFGSKKVLILDLDDTLWGGVVGESGPQGIALDESPEGEAYLALQHYILGIHQRGVLLAVASKNNIEDAQGPFVDNPNMVLKLEHFAAFKANWGPKTDMLEEIAEELRLGLDSFVFLDDNPAEREQIRQAMPMVTVPELPTDPAEYVRAITNELSFESVSTTDTDQLRNLLYQQEKKRKHVQKESGTLHEFLQSLEMQATIVPIDESNLKRVTQLVGKTNQFNVANRRHSHEQIVDFTRVDNSITICASLSDRFGDYGIICVLLAVPDGENHELLRIDTWLMSCRAIGRTVEQRVFNYLIDAAKSQAYRGMIGEYVPTAKNKPVEGLFRDLGFVEQSRHDEIQTFHLELSTTKPTTTFVR
jgi:FkbH-like protein